MAAFIALIALAAGGLLVYQSLTKASAEDDTTALTLDNYYNQPLDSVTAALQALGLTYRAIPEANALVPEQFVHRTNPEAGTVVAEGTVIELYYNPTKALVPVPNVAGRSIEEARLLLGESGFQFTEETELSDVPKGLVIRTDPAGDARVPQETVITVFVSGGPNQVSIPPTVINDEVEVARSLLESAEYGLNVEIQEQVDPIIPAGVVISTNPPPNTLVDKGSTVTLIVSSGPGQERVPPLVGLTEGQARNLLDDRAFGIEVSYRELPPGDSRDGTVLEQSIPTSQMVDKGTVVVVGSLDLVFADYGVAVPTAPVVVSAEDNGVLEVQILLVKE